MLCTHIGRKCYFLTAFICLFGLAIGWRWDSKEVRKFWNLCKAMGETIVIIEHTHSQSGPSVHRLKYRPRYPSGVVGEGS